jgi:hypothetical protein
MWDLLTAYSLVAVLLLVRGAWMSRRNPEMRRRLHSPFHIFAFTVLTFLWIVTVPLSLLFDRDEEKQQEDES